MWTKNRTLNRPGREIFRGDFHSGHSLLYAKQVLVISRGRRDSVQILVLGPPAIREDGQSLELRDRKGVGLLAYLATQGRTTRDKLADLFWTDMNQTDARRNLRQRLYELKGKLPDGCLNTDGDSVSLETSAQTDFQQFRESISAGDDEAAILLWRDSFLHGLELPGAKGFDEWLEPMRETLNTAYHEALRRLATAREERGDLRGALQAHQRLLEDNELQEFHQRETIRLLEALGERESALLQYERYRQTLEQELDDVPLPQTQQLAERVQYAIQRTTDAIVTAEPDALSLELRSPLIGREAEWTRLERAAHGLSLIVGEPGIGKSRLADELAFYTARHGSVRRLQGREGSSGSPLYPVAESLREALREPAWVQILEPIWRVECARLVPEIDPQATPQPMPSLEGRVRFIEGLARALIASVGEKGVIVLDDLHWFDAATLELVGHLARRARDANVRLIATARTEELERNEATAPILVDLKRDGLLTRLDLEPLGERDVRSLIQSLSGGRDAPTFAKRLHTATVGNPFFLLETLRDLFGSGQLYVMADGTWTTPYDGDTESYAELPIPTTVRETVIARVDRTGADARRLLEAASLAGDGFDLALISSATALTEWEGVEAIERAVNAELLEPVNDGYRFNHDLIRRALEDGLNPDRKKLIHRKLAVSLEGANGQPARIAEHYEMGGLARQAAPWRVRAGEEATNLYAYEQALQHFERAIEGSLDSTGEFKVYKIKAQILRILDKRNDAISVINTMLMVAKRLENADFELESCNLLAETVFFNGEPDKALEIINFSLRSIDFSLPVLAQIKITRATINLYLGNKRESEIDFRETIAFGAQCGLDNLAKAHISLSDILFNKGELEESEIQCDLAKSIFDKMQNNTGLARVLYLQSLLESVKYNYNLSLDLCYKAKKIAKEVGIVYLIQSTSLQIAKLCFILNRNDEARDTILNEIGFSERERSPQVEVYYLQCLGRIQFLDDKFLEAIETLEKSMKLGSEIGMADSQITGGLLLMEIYIVLNYREDFLVRSNIVSEIISRGVGVQYKRIYDSLVIRYFEAQNLVQKA
jgi:DNA-binding SARP family transcriptional activator